MKYLIGNKFRKLINKEYYILEIILVPRLSGTDKEYICKVVKESNEFIGEYKFTQKFLDSCDKL